MATPTAHPQLPNPVPLVLDLARQHTLVELPIQVEGTMTEITLVSWHLDSATDPGPYFQVRFSNGLEVRNLTFGGRDDGGAIVGVPMVDAIQIPFRRTTLRVPVIRRSMISRVFTVDLFDSGGNPLTPERCVLWFHIAIQ